VLQYVLLEHALRVLSCKPVQISLYTYIEDDDASSKAQGCTAKPTKKIHWKHEHKCEEKS
jgi:hypothetical protein